LSLLPIFLILCAVAGLFRSGGGGREGGGEEVSNLYFHICLPSAASAGAYLDGRKEGKEKKKRKRFLMSIPI